MMDPTDPEVDNPSDGHPHPQVLESVVISRSSFSQCTLSLDLQAFYYIEDKELLNQGGRRSVPKIQNLKLELSGMEQSPTHSRNS
ncbi:hypothetical protein GDO78_018485 [Eleutherodactylus coqui]|uniref:Uncharacterized protein n=1 Tax=Eleutherodactylus coqui TaxID=57060 RepID=A0A8J6E5M6_ELECQ|nr:hypothetical protein GDO78_018485 [Eleutherodactylus coqui]